MELKIIYQDENVLVIDKPAGINSDDFQKRVHRLDKDTSGILIIAKNDKALEFLQKQFSAAAESDDGQAKKKALAKKYLALVIGNLKNKEGEINTLLGRSPQDRRKQKVYFPHEPGAKGKRKAITKYRVLQKFEKYTLIKVEPKTGRKHQIRAHFAYLGHPIAGDKMYGFKNQPCPKGLKRQFLHATYLKIMIPCREIKEFKSALPRDLKGVIEKLKIKNGK